MLQVVSHRFHMLLHAHARKSADTNTGSWLKKCGIIIGVVLAFSIIISGSAFFLNPFRWVIAASHPSQVVSRGLMDVSVQAPGMLQSGVYNLSFQGVNGNIREIDVQQGQRVVEGQLLARLDTTSLQQSVAVAQASLDAAKENLYGALLHQGDTISAINARIAAVQAVVNAVKIYADATNRDANANVIVAKATLMSDQHILSSIHKTADAQLKQADAQRLYDLSLCPTPTPTPTPAPTPTPTATGNSQISSTVLPTITSASIASIDHSATTLTSKLTVQGSDQSDQSDTLSDTCVQQANATYKQAVAAAHLTVTAATAQVNKDQQQVNLSYANGDVNAAGANSQVVNSHDQAVGDETNTDRTAALSQVKSAEGQLEVATAQFDVATYALSHADLTAPHAGIVTAINGTVSGPPGFPPDIAVSGSAPYGIFIQIVDLTSVQQIMLSVSETDITSVQVGQPIQFHLKAYNDRQFSGVVSAISPNGVASGNGMTYPVITTVDAHNTDGTAMLPNMTATVTINVLHDPNALRVPNGALDVATNKQAKKIASLVSTQESSAATRKAMDMLKQLISVHPDLVSRKPFPTFVVEQSEQDNTLIAKPVVLGLTDGTYYEVLQGISENESVLVGK